MIVWVREIGWGTVSYAGSSGGYADWSDASGGGGFRASHTLCRWLHHDCRESLPRLPGVGGENPYSELATADVAEEYCSYIPR